MKTKALISFAVTAKLICAFVFAYADCWFSHGAAHMSGTCSLSCSCLSYLKLNIDDIFSSSLSQRCLSVSWRRNPPHPLPRSDSLRRKWREIFRNRRRPTSPHTTHSLPHAMLPCQAYSQRLPGHCQAHIY